MFLSSMQCTYPQVSSSYLYSFGSRPNRVDKQTNTRRWKHPTLFATLGNYCDYMSCVTSSQTREWAPESCQSNGLCIQRIISRIHCNAMLETPCGQCVRISHYKEQTHHRREDMLRQRNRATSLICLNSTHKKHLIPPRIAEDQILLTSAPPITSCRLDISLFHCPILWVWQSS